MRSGAVRPGFRGVLTPCRPGSRSSWRREGLDPGRSGAVKARFQGVRPALNEDRRYVMARGATVPSEGNVKFVNVVKLVTPETMMRTCVWSYERPEPATGSGKA